MSVKTIAIRCSFVSQFCVSFDAILVYADLFDESILQLVRSPLQLLSSSDCLFSLTNLSILNAGAPVRLPDGFSASFSRRKQLPYVKYVIRRSDHLDFSINQQNYWLPNEGSS
jgi:hypothetical protein